MLNTIYQRKRDQKHDWTAKIEDAVKPYKGLPGSMATMNAQLQVLQKQVEVFWKGVSFSSAQALHSPHTKELDDLLEKFQRDEIQSEKDLSKLKSMLQEVVDSDPSPLRKKYALDILTLIHVRFEIGGDLVIAMRGST